MVTAVSKKAFFLGSLPLRLILTWATLLLLCNKSLSIRLTDYKLRLADGIHPWEGRPELYINGTWHTICKLDVEQPVLANVLCREMGFQSGVSVMSYIRNKDTTSSIFPGSLECERDFQNLTLCTVSYSYHNACDHSMDLVVNCWDPIRTGHFMGVRLVGGNSPSEGRVEVFYDNEWGSICDDYWDINDAYVVCRQLGYPYALESSSVASFGQGSGTILLDDVSCHGMENNLGECPHGGLGPNNCFHHEDAGAVCSETPFQFSSDLLQFARPPRRYDWCRHGGIVKVNYDNIWWSICADEWWNLVNVETICTQMGYSTQAAVRFYDDALGYDQIRFAGVACVGDEENFLKCPMKEIFPEDCYPARTAGVCCGNPLPDIGHEPSPKQDLYVRLVGSSSDSEGRVEVHLPGESWSTVCDDRWDLQDAEVVCRQLGFPGAKSAHNSAMFGSGSGMILLDNVECYGNETNLGHCQHNGFTNNDCTHEEDAGVSCLQYSHGNSSDDLWGVGITQKDEVPMFSSGAIIVIALVSSFGGILCLTFVSYLSCVMMDKCCCKNPLMTTTPNVRYRNDLGNPSNRYLQDAYQMSQVMVDGDCPHELMLPHTDRPPAYESLSVEEQPLSPEVTQSQEREEAQRPSTPPPTYEVTVGD